MKRHFNSPDFSSAAVQSLGADLVSSDTAADGATIIASLRNLAFGSVSRLTRLQLMAEKLTTDIADEAQLIEISVSGDEAIADGNEAVLFQAATHLMTAAIRDGMRCRIRGRCWISLEADQRADRVVVIDDGWDLTGAESGRDMTDIDRLASAQGAQVLIWRAYGLSVCEFALPTVSCRF